MFEHFMESKEFWVGIMLYVALYNLSIVLFAFSWVSLILLIGACAVMYIDIKDIRKKRQLEVN